jgi:succinylglutamate desuccinylase
LVRRRAAATGQLIGVAGNLAALAQGRRYIDRDLNRNWSDADLSEAVRREAAGEASGEDHEQLAVAACLDGILAAAQGPVYMLDLHTTSSISAPFMLFADTLMNRDFAANFPLPLVLGLEEAIEGALFDHYQGRGVVTLGVEGGQHAAPEAVDNLEAVIWLGLAASGCLMNEDLPEAEALRRRLAAARGAVPAILEVRYRHAIREDDAFRMQPGYVNFQAVAAGERLADDRRGPVRAAEGGRILMPLYQGLGDDGFFMTRPVKPFWLRLSAWLRRRRLAWGLTFLPGVSRDRAVPGSLRIDTRLARIYPLEFFHLLGFRKVRREGDFIRVTRRLHDLPEPGDRIA